MGNVCAEICYYVLRPADVAELVDALVLGTSAARRGGSSPFIRIRFSFDYETYELVS